jgi:hypothetical protein
MTVTHSCMNPDTVTWKAQGVTDCLSAAWLAPAGTVDIMIVVRLPHCLQRDKEGGGRERGRGRVSERQRERESKTWSETEIYI